MEHLKAHGASEQKLGILLLMKNGGSISPLKSGSSATVSLWPCSVSLLVIMLSGCFSASFRLASLEQILPISASDNLCTCEKNDANKLPCQ